MTVWSYVWAPGLACLQAVSKYVCKLHIESRFRIKSLKCPKLKRFNFLLIADLYTDSLPHPWWWLSLAHLATSVNTSLGQIISVSMSVSSATQNFTVNGSFKQRRLSRAEPHLVKDKLYSYATRAFSKYWVKHKCADLWWVLVPLVTCPTWTLRISCFVIFFCSKKLLIIPL